MRSRFFTKFAWGVLFYNILVILWGAYVRATGSGAGCGSHWPTCQGAVVPRTEQIETLVEFSHRVTSGIALLLVIGLLIWAYRIYAPGHRVRKGATYALAFVLLEALIGAGLVLFELVAHNATVARAYSMAAHLINTFLLLGSLTLTAWWATGGRALRLRGQGLSFWTLVVAAGGMLVLGASGAITALGDTLLLGARLSPEESPLLAQLIGLRIYHPLLALAVGGLIYLAIRVNLARHSSSSPRVTRLGYTLGAAVVLQLSLGGLNVVLKAPLWLQLVHLLTSDIIWVLLVLLAATSLSVHEEAVDSTQVGQPALQSGD